MASETDFNQHINTLRFSPQNQNKTEQNDTRLPHSIELEQELIGALLRDNQLLEHINDKLRPDHFYLPLHQLIYATALRLIHEGSYARAETMRYLLEAEPVFQAQDGARYVNELVVNVVTDMNIASHALTLLDLAKKRILLREMSNTSSAIYSEPEKNSEWHIRSLEAITYNISENHAGSSNPEELDFFVAQSMEIINNIKKGNNTSGTSSGFRNIDQYTGGFHRSDLIILAARPSMGKTALASNIAVKAAEHNLTQYENDLKTIQEQNQSENPQEPKKGTILIFSLEMSGEQLATRILCEKASVEPEDIRKNKISNHDFKALSESQAHIQKLPIFIDDSSDISVEHIRQRARRIKRQYPISMIVIDYLQLLHGSSSSRKYDNRVNEITDISRGLKNLAKEMNIPIIALSQLNRRVEERDNAYPQLSDLRDSGSIEQDADVVLFLYREAYYHQKNKPTQKENETDTKFKNREHAHEEKALAIKNQARLIVAKNRHGKTGTVELGFEGRHARFYDVVPEDPNRPPSS
jgi:replicative DNA helicase